MSVEVSPSPKVCMFCNLDWHGDNVVCPHVKAVEYWPRGTIKRVEFKTAADFPIGAGSTLGWQGCRYPYPHLPPGGGGGGAAPMLPPGYTT